MKFKMVHNNFNVFDLEKSLAFYKEALGLKEVRRYEQPEGKFILVFLEDGSSQHQLELTWLKDWDRPYNLGDNEFHLAFVTDEYEESYKKHQEMAAFAKKATPLLFYRRSGRLLVGNHKE